MYLKPARHDPQESHDEQWPGMFGVKRGFVFGWHPGMGSDNRLNFRGTLNYFAMGPSGCCVT